MFCVGNIHNLYIEVEEDNSGISDPGPPLVWGRVEVSGGVRREEGGDIIPENPLHSAIMS